MALMRDPKRLAFIDSLRGIAALYVVIFHITLVPKFKSTIPDLIKPLVLNGWSGVTLFFVISAFTLCYTFQEKHSEKSPVMSFYLRRGFRILPLYYTWLFVMCFMMFGWDLFSGIWLIKKSLVLYIIFGFNFFPRKQEGLVWASWTLGVEMIFYLFFHLIIRFCKNLNRSVIFLLCSFIFSWLHFELTHKSPNYNSGIGILSQLPVFAMGIICYHIFLIINEKEINKRISLLLIICSSIIIIVVPYFPKIFGGIPLNYPMSIAYGTLLIGLSIFPIQIIVNRISVFFGLISYSLYLNHPQLVYYIGDLYKKIYLLGPNTSLSFLMCVLATLLPLTIISFLTYRIIEKPGITLGRNIINLMNAKVD